MRALAIATTLLAFAAAATATAESPFAGTWKLNRDRTQFDADSDILKIEADGSGIRYGGPGFSVYGGPLDGSERPGMRTFTKDTFTLTKKGDRGYQALQSRNGKPLVREVVEASTDGNTLTTSFTSLAPRKDGKQQPTTVFTYNRTGGDGKPYPFIGTWKQDRSLTKWGEESWPMIITESGGVLTMSNPVNDTKTIIDLNKSEVTVTGAFNPATDIIRTAKRIDTRSFEMSTTRGGQTSTSLYNVNADGKTMTIRFTGTGDDGKTRSTTTFYARQ